jgi:hypothetical protein
LGVIFVGYEFGMGVALVTIEGIVMNLVNGFDTG